MTNSLRDRVIAAAKTATLTIENIELDPELDFYTQGLDSLDHVQIIMRIDEAFGIRIKDTDFDECNSIDNIAAYLLRHNLAGT